MPTDTWQEWAAIAEICIAFLTAVGVVYSILSSAFSIREIRRDRIDRQRPQLLFESMGIRVPLAHNAHAIGGKTIGGNLPDVNYGTLVNFGNGPALEVLIRWLPKTVVVAGEKFIIDETKLSEEEYCEESNTMPSNPSYILSGKSSELSRFPFFIYNDDQNKRKEIVEGVLIIKYKDALGNPYLTRQGFYIQTFYKAEIPAIHVSFRNLLRDGEEGDTSCSCPGCCGLGVVLGPKQNEEADNDKNEVKQLESVKSK
jgi:hypothetical protein